MRKKRSILALLVVVVLLTSVIALPAASSAGNDIGSGEVDGGVAVDEGTLAGKTEGDPVVDTDTVDLAENESEGESASESETAVAVGMAGLSRSFFGIMGGGNPNPGSIWTTDIDGNVNVTQYELRSDVYLNGGPKGGGSSLPDGDYYVKVTSPNGDILGASPDRPITVTDGKFIVRYQLIELVYSTSSDYREKGFDLSQNGYKVWVSMNSQFPENESKTNGFSVAESLPTTGTLVITKEVVKLVEDGEEAVEGDETSFSFTVTCPEDYSNTFTLKAGEEKTLEELKPGKYTITEEVPAGYELLRSGTLNNINLKAGDEIEVTVTNRKLLGELKVMKKILAEDGSEVSGSEHEEAEFTVNVNAVALGYDKTDSVTLAEPVILSLIPGTYCVSEIVDANPAGYSYKRSVVSSPAGLGQVNDNAAAVEVRDGVTSVVTVFNEVESPPQGTLKIVKRIVDEDGNDIEGDYEGVVFTVTIRVDSEYEEEIEITVGENEITLPVGTYEVEETGMPLGYQFESIGISAAVGVLAAEADNNTVQVTVTQDASVEVLICNTPLTSLGTLEIVKRIVDEDGNDIEGNYEDVEFTVVIGSQEIQSPLEEKISRR